MTLYLIFGSKVGYFNHKTKLGGKFKGRKRANRNQYWGKNYDKIWCHFQFLSLAEKNLKSLTNDRESMKQAFYFCLHCNYSGRLQWFGLTGLSYYFYMDWHKILEIISFFSFSLFIMLNISVDFLKKKLNKILDNVNQNQAFRAVKQWITMKIFW